MYHLRRFTLALSILVCFILQAQGADKDTDENRPYEFGFNVEVEGQKQQHRHEKKDKDGIIMGEFGFVTADDVYHVTVYATDKEGRFKILSVKNIHLKSSPGAGAAHSARQGHSLTLPAQPAAPAPQANAVPQASQPPTPPKPVVLQPPGRSCSSCSIPTTTRVPPPASFTNQNQQTYAAAPALPNNGIQNGQPNGFGQPLSPQSGSPNYPQQGIVGSQGAQGFAGQQGQSHNPPNGSPNYPQQGIAGPQGAQGFPGQPGQSLSLPNGSPNYPQQGIAGPQGAQGFPGLPGQPQQGFPGQPGQPQPNFPGSSNGAPNSFTPSLGSGLSPPLGQIPLQGDQLNNPQYSSGQFPAQNVAPQSTVAGRTSKQYTGPERQFDSNLGTSAQGQPGPMKPTLVSAQMQIVDKDTDIHSLRPGEKPGLPAGLSQDDMTQLLYTFNYTVGFHGHFEEGYRNGAKKGYYYVTGRNGVRTRIDYTADDTGFHPKVSQEVLDLLSDDVPKPETEKDEKYGLKGYEFKWLYYPVESNRR